MRNIDIFEECSVVKQDMFGGGSGVRSWETGTELEVAVRFIAS